MEILEFIVFCAEALCAWRLSSMIIVGIILAALSLIFLTGPVSIILAVVFFVSCCVRGYYWNRAAERRMG